MMWFVNDDPTKIQALEQMPTLDYLILLDKKIGDMKKVEQNGRANNNRVRS